MMQICFKKEPGNKRFEGHRRKEQDPLVRGTDPRTWIHTVPKRRLSGTLAGNYFKLGYNRSGFSTLLF
jgi:hypothetical protein